MKKRLKKSHVYRNQKHKRETLGRALSKGALGLDLPRRQRSETLPIVTTQPLRLDIGNLTGYRPRSVLLVSKTPQQYQNRNIQTRTGPHWVDPLAGRSLMSYPSNATPCARRSTRKQVLHALGFSGKNGGKHYRRTEASHIHCKG